MNTKSITLTLILLSIFASGCLSTRRRLARRLKSRFDSQCPASEFHAWIPDNGKFVVKDFKVTTEDGYILQYFKVSLSKAEQAKLSAKDKKNVNKPVHFQHGLNGDPVSYMLWSKTFPWYFINHGYDVWFGNNRGHKFSTQTTEPMSESAFWNYSFTELGLYDMPAYFKFLIAQYKNDDLKIIHVGHSQGTSQMFVALTDPKTKDFMRKHTERFFALAPIAYLSKMKGGAMMDFLVQMKDYAAPILRMAGIYAIFVKNCGYSDSDYLGGYATSLINSMASKAGFSSRGTGMGVHSVVHYAQMMAGDSGKPVFRPYDLGASGNQKAYGSATPPEWKFDDWVTPLHLVVGESDFLGSIENVQILVDKLPAAFKDSVSMVPYGHVEFAYTGNTQPMYDIFDKALA